MTYRLLFLIAAISPAQTRPQFDAASIKPAGEATRANQRSYGNPGLGKYVAMNTPLLYVIEQAYGVRTAQILGGPGWVTSDGYDILARAEESPKETEIARRSTITHMFEQDRLRLQALLEDRLSLKVHRETRDVPVFALTIAKGGLKIKPSNCVPLDLSGHPSPLPAGQPRPDFCGMAPYEQNHAFFKITASGTTMTGLARSLLLWTDRPVIDRTGYAEPFNATLEWYEADSKYASPDDSPGPSLFTALQEQLGLKLESTRGPVERLVIDHIERPSAN